MLDLLFGKALEVKKKRRKRYEVEYKNEDLSLNGISERNFTVLFHGLLAVSDVGNNHNTLVVLRNY